MYGNHFVEILKAEWDHLKKTILAQRGVTQKFETRYAEAST